MTNYARFMLKAYASITLLVVAWHFWKPRGMGAQVLILAVIATVEVIERQVRRHLP